jgi:hypothetical protein
MLVAILLIAGGGGLAVRVAYGQGIQSLAALPDWSGVWAMQGPTVFDRATVRPPDGRAGDAGVREVPPYRDEWEAKYKKNIDLIGQGRLPDPITTCGTPHGFPRVMNLPDVYEFAVTRAAVWILAENGPNIVRIYTDGRQYPPAETCGQHTPALLSDTGRATRLSSPQSASKDLVTTTSSWIGQVLC